MSTRKSGLECHEVPPGKRTRWEENNNDSILTEGNNNDSDLTEGNSSYSFQSDCSIPLECFVIASYFLIPLDVYHLCLTSRVFHGASCTKAGTLKESLVSEESKSVARVMLNASMTTSLAAVLRHNRAGFGVAEFKNLCSSLLVKGQSCNSVLLSGSIVLQAMLGGPFSKHSTTDIDIFCSREAATTARTWLVDPKGGNALYYRTKNNLYTSTFCQYVDRNTGGDIVSHVEAYGPMPSKRELSLNRLRVSSDIRGLNDRTTQQIRRLQKIRFPLRSQNEIEQDPRSDFSCDPKSPHPFLFIDQLGRHDELSDDESSVHSADSDDPGMPKPNVDLVIAEEGSTALDLVKRFDLDVCMCSYDGQTFRIENPKHVFNTLPKDGGGYLSVPISSILRHDQILREFFVVKWSAHRSTARRLAYLEGTDEDSTFIQYLRHMGVGELDLYSDAEQDNDYGRHVCQRVIDVHCFLVRAVMRVNKYRLRGVKILDSDHIPYSYHGNVGLEHLM